MNKNDIINAIAEATDLSKAKTAEVVDAFINVVTKALKKKEEVKLIGFGTFSVAERAERQGVNPATGAKITIAAKKSVKFKAGSALNAKL